MTEEMPTLAEIMEEDYEKAYRSLQKRVYEIIYPDGMLRRPVRDELLMEKRRGKNGV